ncbi:MAG: hypothetical protein M1830_000568 [Pleopsidium flavum]|nr:MAG: hypothetical protein M1830_004208 [Pleopsidium flavum]KAI9878559.1 MAG: hypothetical protein M1830_000568 [Pleopsidium flavum]
MDSRDGLDANSTLASSLPPTCFTCTRLNPTTFLIVEADNYGELPFIYVKIYTSPPLVVVSDVGCGTTSCPATVEQTSLRQFLEGHPISSNDNQPLNSHKAPYLIICTHCHYDHIGGIGQFTDESSTSILACVQGKSFVENDLPTHSLCRFLDLSTPRYTVTHWAHDQEALHHPSYPKVPLGLLVLSTPGHSPDELAWYDEQERWLFVGDTFYERINEDLKAEIPIIFPLEGDWVDVTTTLDKLLGFVRTKNADSGKERVKIACGHITSNVDGEEILVAVQDLFWNIVMAKVPVKETKTMRGELVDLWKEDGQPRFSVRGPRRLVEEARRHFKLSSS